MPRRQVTRLAVMVALVSVFAAASVARAQPSVEITPFVGYYLASDIYNTYASTSANYAQIKLQNSFMWGGRLTAINGRGGVEFAYTRTGSDIKLTPVLSGQPNDAVGHVDFDNYDLNFIAFQQTGNPRLTPFFSFGLGWAVSHPGINSSFLLGAAPESNTLFNFNFGIGVKLAMNPKLSSRFDGRWRVMDTSFTSSNTAWCDPYGYCYSFASSWYSSGELTAGLSYAFR